MQAPESILIVWNKFKYFPMENFTKVWYAKQNPMQRQRSVPLMKQHYERYKITGNCFGLAILYKRPNGKVSNQTYDLMPIEDETLLKDAEFSQQLINNPPLFECRQYGEEVVHWEFYKRNKTCIGVDSNCQ